MALLRLTLLVLALASLLPGSATAQSGAAGRDLTNAVTTLREIDVENYPQVNMRVVVTDGGALVTGLGPPNFRVYENDGARGDLTVTPYTPPLSIVLAIDSSGSMSAAMTETKFAAQSLIDRLADSDRAQIVSFADEVSTLAALTSDKTDLADAIFGLRAWGNTRLYDALAASVGMVPNEPGARTAVILLSDGLDSDGNGNPMSALSQEQAVAAAIGSGVPIFAIGLGGAINADLLAQIAEGSGGGFYAAADSSALGDIYRQIGDRLLEQEYLVSFTSPLVADGTSRQLEIIVAGSKDDTPRQTARVVRMPGEQAGRFSMTPGGAPATTTGSTGSVSAGSGTATVDATAIADDLAEQLTALAGGGSAGAAPAPVDPGQVAALLGVSTSELDPEALSTLPPDMLGEILAVGMGGPASSVDPASISTAVSALNAANGTTAGAGAAGAALAAIAPGGGEATAAAPAVPTVPAAPGAAATGAFSVSPGGQPSGDATGGGALQPPAADGTTVNVPVARGTAPATPQVTTTATAPSARSCSARPLLEREADTIRSASRSFGAGGLDSETRAALSGGAAQRMARGATESAEPLCLAAAFESLTELRRRGDLTEAAYASAAQILQQGGRAACRRPANGQEVAACETVFEAQFADAATDSDAADTATQAGTQSGRTFGLPDMSDRGDFLAFVEAKIEEHLGPMGNWIVLGGLGLLLILLTLPVMLVKREDPLDKLKLAQGDHKDLIEATKLRQGRTSADKLEKYSNFLEPKDKAEYSAIQLKLLQAGYRTKGAVRMYHFAQFALGILFLLGGVAYAVFKTQTAIAGEEPTTQSTMLTIIIPGAIGYMIPKYWVNKRQQERQQEIEDGFPDSLDMMLVCVEAGQSLDQAIIRVARELKAGFPALSWEFELVAYEMKAGKDKTAVLKDMAERCGVPDVTSFVTVLVQSQQFGTSIADALRIYAGEMRDKRVMRAEEKANTLPTKMTLATMMLTVPPLLIILIGPSVFDIYENLILGGRQ